MTDIEKNLERCVQSYTEGNAAGLTLGLRSSARMLSQALLEAYSDIGLLGKITKQSIWHPNGFAKVVLIDRTDFRLRLHFWGHGGDVDKVCRENVHSHRWDFSALIIMGSYVHQEFCESSEEFPQDYTSTDSFYKYRYTSDDFSKSYTMIPQGLRSLRQTLSARLATGSEYSLSSRVLHRVIPAAEPTTSLVLEGPHYRKDVDVYSECEMPLGGSVGFDRLTSEYVRSLLSGVLEVTR